METPGGVRRVLANRPRHGEPTTIDVRDGQPSRDATAVDDSGRRLFPDGRRTSCLYSWVAPCGSGFRLAPRRCPLHGCRGSARGVVAEGDQALRSTAREEQAVQSGAGSRPACAVRVGEGPIGRNRARTRSGDTSHAGCRWDIQIREHLSSGAAVEVIPHGERGEDFVRGHVEGDCRALRRRPPPLADAEGRGIRRCSRTTAARGCEAPGANG
jgi:hypothetical protein